MHNKSSFWGIVFPIVVAFPFVLLACSKIEPTEDYRPQNILVTLAIHGQVNSPRVATINPLPYFIPNNSIATVNYIDLYFTDNDGKVIMHEHVDKQNNKAEYDRLTTTAPINEQNESTVGLKFLNVPHEVRKLYVIVNAQGTPLQKDQNISQLPIQQLTPHHTQVVYIGEGNITPMGSSEPNTVGSDIPLQKIELKAYAVMNRFQIGPKFCSIVFQNDGMAKAYAELKREILTQHPNYNNQQLLTELKTTYKLDFRNGTPTTEWSRYFKVVDITSQLQGVFMNRFAKTYTPTNNKTSPLLEILSYRKHGNNEYNKSTGELLIAGDNDITAMASYFDATGKGFGAGAIENAPTASTNQANKVFAFNFFYQPITAYGAEGNAPKLHFFFRSGQPNNTKGEVVIPNEKAFLNVKGYVLDADDYTTDNHTNLDYADMQKGAKLLNIDFRKFNGGNGPILTSDDENVSGWGQPDIDISFVIKVTVVPWISVEHTPEFSED